MKTFKDRNDQVWTLEATTPAMKRIRDLAKWDPMGLLGNKEHSQILIGDVELFVNALYAWCLPQCQANSINDEQFAELMYGRLDEAFEAFWEELPSFFIGPQRTKVAALLQTAKNLVKQETEKQVKMMQSPRIMQMHSSAVERIQEQSLDLLEKQLGGLGITGGNSIGSAD